MDTQDKICDQCGESSSTRTCGLCIYGALSGHEWRRANSVIGWVHCAICLKIRRHDGKNKPCPGHGRLRTLIERGCV